MVESVPLIQFVFSSIKENEMRLTKRHLKRIIREEYSRLKRRGLIKEGRNTRRNRRRVLRESQWQMNPEMGGPEDQYYPEGTSIEDAAKQAVEDIRADYGQGVLDNLSDLIFRGEHMDDALYQFGEEEGDELFALQDALEGGDIGGSGNYEYSAWKKALGDAIGRAG